jgi:hypothetical protein
MNCTNQDIKNHFDFFTELLEKNKIVLTKTIQLKPKANNVRWLIGQSIIQHDTISDPIVLFVERSTRDAKYGIKLRCSSLTEGPFFRFDSDGPAHRNNFPDIPLEEQEVTTPHFNSYRNDGKLMAYKNKTLRKENEVKAIVEDINFGVSLFCMETNSKLVTGGFPTIIDQEPKIEFENAYYIEFENINFE